MTGTIALILVILTFAVLLYYCERRLKVKRIEIAEGKLGFDTFGGGLGKTYKVYIGNEAYDETIRYETRKLAEIYKGKKVKLILEVQDD